MNHEPVPAPSTAEAIRRAFDEAFAAPPRVRDRDSESLLAIRVAGEPFAIRVREIAGLVPPRKVVPLPTRLPELLGLAGIRGEIVPVYSLATLLGYRPTDGGARRLVLCGSKRPIALAFEALEGHLSVSPSDLYAAETPREHIRVVARAGAAVRPVVDLPSVLESIQRRLGPAHAAPGA